MKIIPFSAVNELLVELSVAWDQENDANNNYATCSELMTIWQLLWMMSLGGLQVQDSLVEKFERMLERCKAGLPIEFVQQIWMKCWGLPGRFISHQTNPLALFYERAVGLFFSKDEFPEGEEFALSYLEVLAGVDRSERARVLELFRRARAAAQKPQWTVIDAGFVHFVWLPPEFVIEFIQREISSDFKKFLNHVAVAVLPRGIETPMTWVLPSPRRKRLGTIFLGWPAGEPTSLSAAEQQSLLRHELCHVEQILSEFNPVNSGPLFSAYQREKFALEMEWRELLGQSKKLTHQELRATRRRWLEINLKQPTKQVGIDLERFSMWRHQDSKFERFPPSVSERLRLPFFTALYALSAQDVGVDGAL